MMKFFDAVFCYTKLIYSLTCANGYVLSRLSITMDTGYICRYKRDFLTKMQSQTKSLAKAIIQVQRLFLNMVYENLEMYSTFDTMRPHFDALARVAYFKIVLRPTTRFRRFLHNVYRVIVWILVIFYNLQHVIRVIQTRHSTDEMVDTLFILLTTLNTLGKQVAFNVRSSRVDHIIDIINGPCFALSKPYHIEVMKANGLIMNRLLKLYQVAVITCGCLWTAFPIVNRALGEGDKFTGYIPFDTSKNTAFGLAHAYMCILITFQAYGNVTMDCTIVAFYSQAKTQIQIMRYNLEQLSKINGRYTKDNKHDMYTDNTQGDLLQKRFIRCVEHYKQIIWFVNEVESIFGEAMVMQFLVMSWVICMTVYKIVGLSILSAEFVSMAVYLGCMLAQLFIYCYFGTQLKYESECVNDSVYNSDWLSLSPRFRRQLLVVMQYCSKPINPRTAYIIPMSLETYIKVLKSSYTLFTFLNRK